MLAQRYCAFCQISGVKGPHDHYVRASRKQDAPVTCPRLRATECSFCNKLGHTAKYCGEREDAMRLAKKAATAAKKTSFECGEWSIAAPQRNASRKPTPIATTVKRSTSAFAALELENSSDSEQDCGDEVMQPTVPVKSVPTGPSWADVTKRPAQVKQIVLKKRPTGISWADWMEDDE